MKDTITIDLEYAKNIHKVLEGHICMGFAIVSLDIKNIVSEEAYKKLTDIFYKYHNANCGPFNRHLKKLIDDASNSNSSSDKSESFNKGYEVNQK